MKAAGERITMVTAYDCDLRAAARRGRRRLLLVGDSLGMVVQGHETTLPVTLDEMVYHTRMVARGAARALVVGDLPFGSLPGEPRRSAVESAIRLVKEGGAAGGEARGRARHGATDRGASRAVDIPVMGHVGLTPQSVHRMGGHKVQGRRHGHAPGGRERVIEDARAVEAAGAFAVVLEGIPLDLAAEITADAHHPDHRHRRRRPLRRPGARAARPARALDAWTPRFAKRYAELGREVVRAAERRTCTR